MHLAIVRELCRLRGCRNNTAVSAVLSKWAATSDSQSLATPAPLVDEILREIDAVDPDFKDGYLSDLALALRSQNLTVEPCGSSE